MRITTVIGSLSCGGAERNLIKLSPALAEQGHELVLLTLSDSISQSDFFQVPASVIRRHAGLEAGIDYRWYDLPAMRRRSHAVRQALLASAPDVVISFLDTINLNVLVSLIGVKVPVVVCERSNLRHSPLGWRFRLLRRLVYPRAAAVVVQTQASLRYCKKRYWGWRLRQIPNWVEPFMDDSHSLMAKNQPPALLQKSFTVLAVGRLHPIKGHDVLIRAMAKLVVRYQNLQLVILGEGPARDYLQRLIVDLGLQNVVILPGAVSNPYRWMAFSDLFVMPSRSEGFPTALAEAMSLGCTVISCNCPDGPDEIIRHQHDGLLIPVDDDQALIEAMQVLIDDPLRCKRFGAAARGGINLRFSKSRVLAQWQKLILEVSG